MARWSCIRQYLPNPDGQKLHLQVFTILIDDPEIYYLDTSTKYMASD
jgi:hypothetical protein